MAHWVIHLCHFVFTLKLLSDDHSGIQRTYLHRTISCWGMANNKSLIHKFYKNKLYFVPPQTEGRQPYDTWSHLERRKKIEQVDSFNFLGVVIDKHISWKYHTEMLSNKISKYCGELSRLKNYLPLFILRTLYFSMVHSHLSYSLLTWASIVIE